MKLVSLILPCYNHANYIDDCLNSLCAQTYENLEIFITDDCSRDDSFARLQAWQQRLEERFVAVSIRKNEENQGVVKTLNSMLKDCRGDYIKVLATDDMLLPDGIENLVSFARQEDSDLVFSNVYLFDETMHYPISDPDKLETYYPTAPTWSENPTGDLLAHNFICAPGVLMPRRTIETFGLYDPAYIMEDFEYWLRVSVSGKISYLDRCTTLYRVNHNSMSHFSLNEAQLRKHRLFYEQTRAIFSQYESHGTPSQKAQFFNHELGTTIGLGDKSLAKEIRADMKNRALPLSLWNQFRYILLQANVYLLLKKCKHLLKGK